MRPVLLAASLALAAGAAAAQTPINPPTPSILTWQGEQQATGFRSIQSIYKTHTIKRGETVHPLPRAARQIEAKWSFGGKDWDVDSYMAANRVSGLLVLKDGQVVLEKYGLGRTAADRWVSFSVSKSVTSTLVGAAIKDGKIKSLAAPITDYIPELKGSAYDGVTVRQMLMMSSGVKWNEDYADPNSDVARGGTALLEPGINPLVSYLRRLPRADPPGATFNYNTGETDLVGVLVSNATGKTLAEYASEKIWKPYGMESDADWMTDLSDHERGGCCISMTLRDYARIGQFILDGGRVGDGRSILPEGWVEEATAKQIDFGAPQPGRGYGYFWWPMSADRYDALGIFGQSIATFRKDRVIVVQNAAWIQADGDADNAARDAMTEAVHKAARQSP